MCVCEQDRETEVVGLHIPANEIRVHLELVICVRQLRGWPPAFRIVLHSTLPRALRQDTPPLASLGHSERMPSPMPLDSEAQLAP